MDQHEKEAIAKRAFEKFLKRGGIHGHHDHDWLEAEREIRDRNVKTDRNYKDTNRMPENNGPPGHRHGRR